MLHNIFNLSFLITSLQAQILTIGLGQNGNTFTPSTVNAAVGTTVVFVWISGSHDVTQTNDNGCTNITSGGFTSGAAVDQPGKKFNYTITKTGTFWYTCSVHCATGMKGVIKVDTTLPTTLPTPPPTVPSPTSSKAMSNILGSTWITLLLNIGVVTTINLFL